jgi:hypothetical protein
MILFLTSAGILGNIPPKNKGVAMAAKPSGDFDLATQIRALHEQKRALDNLIKQVELLNQDSRSRLMAVKRSAVRATRASPR